jgi:long-chain acyl-CoA synthetase
MLLARSALTPDGIALWHSRQAGMGGQQLAPTTGQVAALSSGLHRLGLARRAGGIMAPSCREWDFAHSGSLAAGGAAVGLDPYALDEHMREIARRCQFAGSCSRILRCSTGSASRCASGCASSSASMPAGDTGVVSLATLLAEVPASEDWNQAQPDARRRSSFTSGTTGEPKGIEYSHRQMCLAASAILSAFPQVVEGSRLACWLPLSNLFQRMINLSAIGRGAQTFYVSDPREIMRFVQFIAPHLFIGVPRFYEKLYAGIAAGDRAQPAWRQRLVQWAWRVGDRRAAASAQGSARAFVCGLLSRLPSGLPCAGCARRWVPICVHGQRLGAHAALAA